VGSARDVITPITAAPIMLGMRTPRANMARGPRLTGNFLLHNGFIT
jgi:hypothetical protein